MTLYNAHYERDEDGWWVVSVAEVPGCRSQGRTIEQARTRIREALQLFVEDAETAPLKDHIRLPKTVAAALKRRERARAQRELFEKEERDTTQLAARALVKDGYGMRDTGALLNLSYQRVQQIVGKRSTAVAPRKRSAARSTRKR